jgi:hypothetical protein
MSFWMHDCAHRYVLRGDIPSIIPEIVSHRLVTSQLLVSGRIDWIARVDNILETSCWPGGGNFGRDLVLDAASRKVSSHLTGCIYSECITGMRSDRHFQKALSRGGTFGDRGLGMPMPTKFV